MSTQHSRKPSLGRQRRRARTLVQQHQTHDSAAAVFLRAHHPGFANLSNDEIFARPLHLSDAQLALSHEYGPPSPPQSHIARISPIGKPRIIPDRIERPEYRRELALRRGLPSIGTKQVSEHGVEYTVIDHGFALSHGGVAPANGGKIVPQIDEFLPLIALSNMSPLLHDFYAEVDRCTSRSLQFFDTMPDRFPREAVPGVHVVQTTQDPSCLIFRFDACRLHETIVAHELGHLWIEFVEDCEDYRHLRDQSDMTKVMQFQLIQSFVLDLRVNDLLESRGFDMSVINDDQIETIREMAEHCGKGHPPRTKRVAAGIANIIAAAILEQKRWPKSALAGFQTDLAIIQARQPELYRLVEQFVASVERHGYANKSAVRRVIDECAAHSFQATGEDFNTAHDLAEIPQLKWMEDKYPDFLIGLPVAVKHEIGKEAARRGLGANIKWRYDVSSPGRVDVRLRDSNDSMAEQLVLSIVKTQHQPSISRLQPKVLLPTPQFESPQRQPWQQPLMPSPTTPHLRMPTPIPPQPIVPMMIQSALPASSLPQQVIQQRKKRPDFPSTRHYMTGIGRWFSRAGFEEQQAGEHPYGYAENNPVNAIDPSGMVCCRPSNVTASSSAGACRAGAGFLYCGYDLGVNFELDWQIPRGDDGTACSVYQFYKGKEWDNFGKVTIYNKWMPDNALGWPYPHSCNSGKKGPGNCFQQDGPHAAGSAFKSVNIVGQQLDYLTCLCGTDGIHHCYAWKINITCTPINLDFIHYVA